MSLHLEVLDEEARRALDAHAFVAATEGFHLAGGTSLALQLGHRRSVDFDWFREAEFDPLDLAHVLTALTYFDDAERDTEPVLGSREDWPGVKSAIRAWVRGLAGE